ncbi:hypothetical protein RI367_004866 [Sorochytrium milnesiophthora]
MASETGEAATANSAPTTPTETCTSSATANAVARETTSPIRQAENRRTTYVRRDLATGRQIRRPSRSAIVPGDHFSTPTSPLDHDPPKPQAQQQQQQQQQQSQPRPAVRRLPSFNSSAFTASHGQTAFIPASEHEIQHLYVQLASAHESIKTLEAKLAEQVELRERVAHDLHIKSHQYSELEAKYERLKKVTAMLSTDNIVDAGVDGVRRASAASSKCKPKLSLPDLTSDENAVSLRPVVKRTNSENSIGVVAKGLPSTGSMDRLRDKAAAAVTPSPRLSHCIPHRFTPSPLATLSKLCQVCHSAVWNRDGMKCQDCKYVVHSGCASQAPPDCNLKALDDAVLAALGSSLNGSATQMTTASTAAHESAHPAMTLKRDVSTGSLSAQGVVQSRNQTFGIPLEMLPHDDTDGVPSILADCLAAVEKRGLDEVGIYRVPGLKTDIDKLHVYFSYGKPNLEEYFVHSIASLLKRFLRELPDPVCTFALYRDFMQAVSRDNPDDLKKVLLAQVIQQLPAIHFNTLCRMVQHLRLVAQHSSSNKMTPSSLGVVFGPTLLRDLVDHPYDIGAQASAIELMISHFDDIFADPVENSPATTTDQVDSGLPAHTDFLPRPVRHHSSESLSSKISRSLCLDAPMSAPLQGMLGSGALLQSQPPSAASAQGVS